jgi:urease accessory protein
MNKKLPVISGALLVVLPGLAGAHPGHEAGAGFTAGVVHPLAGFDHLSALLAVGLLAGRMGGRAGVAIAASFLALMCAGIVGGFVGVELPLVEAGIGASIITVSLLALRPPRRLPVATAALAGFFAVFHGQAHGAEAVEGTARLAYASGLLVASAAVVGAGILLAHTPVGIRERFPHRRR